MKCRTLGLGILAFLNLSIELSADSTISETGKYAHSTNCGWTDFRNNPASGVTVAGNILSGFAYAANLGWINLGDGNPDDNVFYSNTSSTDFGVNLNAYGQLSGYAYSANTGWIIFEQTYGQPTINYSDGTFFGWVYSANIGWINLDTVTTNSIVCPDSDSDGIADYYEYKHFENLSTANAISNSDGDQHSDLNEYLANTNPLDPGDSLTFAIQSVTNSGGGGNHVDFEIHCGPGRVLTVAYSSDLDSLTGNGTYQPQLAGPIDATFPIAGSTTTILVIDDPNTPELEVSKCFFQITPGKPLQP